MQYTCSKAMQRTGATGDMEYLAYTCPPNMVANEDGENHVLTGQKRVDLPACCKCDPSVDDDTGQPLFAMKSRCTEWGFVEERMQLQMEEMPPTESEPVKRECLTYTRSVLYGCQALTCRTHDADGNSYPCHDGKDADGNVDPAKAPAVPKWANAQKTIRTPQICCQCPRGSAPTGGDIANGCTKLTCVYDNPLGRTEKEQQFICGDGMVFNEANANSPDRNVATCCECADGYAPRGEGRCAPLTCSSYNEAGEEYPCGEGASIPPGKREETDRKYHKCCKCDDDYYLSGTQCLPRTCAAAKLNRDTGEPIPFSCGASDTSCMVFNPDAGDQKITKAAGRLNIDTCCMIKNEGLYFPIVGEDGVALLSNGCEPRTCTFNDAAGGDFPCEVNGGQMRLLARLSKKLNPDFPTCCKCMEGYAPVQGDTSLKKGCAPVTCANIDGSDTPYPCDDESQISVDGNPEEPVSPDNCCQCRPGFAKVEFLRGACLELSCKFANALTGESYDCGVGAELSRQSLALALPSRADQRFAACCRCQYPQYLPLNGIEGNECVLRTCANVDGSGTPFPCKGTGVTFNETAAERTDVEKGTCCMCNDAAGFLPRGDKYRVNEAGDPAPLLASVLNGCMMPRASNVDGEGTALDCGTGAILSPFAQYVLWMEDSGVEDLVCSCDAALGYVPQPRAFGVSTGWTGCELGSCQNPDGSGVAYSCGFTASGEPHPVLPNPIGDNEMTFDLCCMCAEGYEFAPPPWGGCQLSGDRRTLLAQSTRRLTGTQDR